MVSPCGLDWISLMYRMMWSVFSASWPIQSFFSLKTVIEHLLCARYCPGCCEHSGEQPRCLQPRGVCVWVLLPPPISPGLMSHAVPRFLSGQWLQNISYLSWSRPNPHINLDIGPIFFFTGEGTESWPMYCNKVEGVTRVDGVRLPAKAVGLCDTSMFHGIFYFPFLSFFLIPRCWEWNPGLGPR